MEKIVLASKSPRRQELLKEITMDFTIDVCNKKERKPLLMTLTKVPIYLAKQKALDVYKRHQDSLVIGADTVVIINHQILGKPKNKKEVIKMITMLSGKTHLVVTGVFLKSKNISKKFNCITKVTFKKLSVQEINDYCNLQTIYDKAGAYAIQGEAGKFISHIEGDYNNVVGLPIKMLKEYLN